MLGLLRVGRRAGGWRHVRSGEPAAAAATAAAARLRCLVQHRPIRFFIIQRWMEKVIKFNAGYRSV